MCVIKESELNQQKEFKAAVKDGRFFKSRIMQDEMDKIWMTPEGEENRIRKSERRETLQEAAKICRDLYESHYEISMKEYIDGYDEDDQEDVKYNHWVRACGAVECAEKLEKLCCGDHIDAK